MTNPTQDLFKRMKQFKPKICPNCKSGHHNPFSRLCEDCFCGEPKSSLYWKFDCHGNDAL